jgi:hypothetical protein
LWSWLEQNTVGLISLLISIVAIVVSVALSRRTLEKSEEIAQKYGDLAGTKAAIQHEEEKAAQARTIALLALSNEVERILEFARHNAELDPGSYPSAIRMPVTALETAFLSGESVLVGEWEDSELLDFVRSYLTGAYSINASIDFYLTFPGSLGTAKAAGDHMVRLATEIRDRSQELVKDLCRLEEHLARVKRSGLSPRS